MLPLSPTRIPRLLALAIVLCMARVGALAQTPPDLFAPTVSREEAEWIRQASDVAATNSVAAASRLATHIGPKTSAALDFTLGNIHYQATRHKEAAAAYRDALKKFPRFRAARINLSRVLLWQDQPDQATQVLQDLVSDGQGDADTFLLLGHALMSCDAPISAETAYREALLRRSGDLDALLGLARSLLPQDRPAETLALTREILHADPTRREVWGIQVNTLLRLDRAAEAAQTLEAARRLQLADASMLAMLGDLHLDARRYADALACYEAAFAGKDAVSPSRMLRSMEAFLRAGQPVPATRLDTLLDQADLPPKERHAWQRLSAELMAQQGQPGEAIKRLDALLREAPLDGRALLQLAEMHRSADRLEQAILTCERAARIPETQVEALLLQAQIEVQRQRYASAADLLESAQALRPEPRVQHYLDQVRRLRDTLKRDREEF